MGSKCSVGHSLGSEGWSLGSTLACPYCLYELDKDRVLVNAIPECDREVILAALKRTADPNQKDDGSCCP